MTELDRNLSEGGLSADFAYLLNLHLKQNIVFHSDDRDSFPRSIVEDFTLTLEALSFQVNVEFDFRRVPFSLCVIDGSLLSLTVTCMYDRLSYDEELVFIKGAKENIGNKLSPRILQSLPTLRNPVKIERHEGAIEFT